MKERTKDTIRDGFGSLVNNAAAIRGAKNGPLWLTIIFFVLSLLLPVLPIFVSACNIKGSSFINTYSYNLERYVPALATELKDTRKAEFIIGDDHKLSIKEGGAEIPYESYGSARPYIAYENEVTKQYDFVVYVADAPTNKEKKVVNTAISANKYTIGTTTFSADTENYYTPSYMILYRDGLYVAIYAPNTTKAVAASFVGDYKKMKTNNALEDLLKVTDKEGNAVAQNLTNTDYTDGVLKNFKKVLDKSYETSKVSAVWGTSGIYVGVFAGLMIIMGFIIWILTRGKNNPNNYFSLWLTSKISARLALAPALITLIVGFFLTQYAPIVFILTLGLRVMWVSMKDLKPIQ